MSAARDLFAAPRPAPKARAPEKARPLSLTNPNGAFQCAECQSDAHFGFGQKRGEPLAGVWYCAAHKGLGT